MGNTGLSYYNSNNLETYSPYKTTHYCLNIRNCVQFVDQHHEKLFEVSVSEVIPTSSSHVDLQVTGFWQLLFSLRGSTFEPKSRIESQQNKTYHIVKYEKAKQRLRSNTNVSTLCEEANVWTSVISVSDCGRARSGDNRAYCPKFRTPGTLADSRGSLFINPEHSSRTCCRA